MFCVAFIAQHPNSIKKFLQLEAICQNQIRQGNKVVCTTHHIMHLMKVGGANPD